MKSDSPVQIVWGDMGIGNFFISKKDLANLDFSNVLYNWDFSNVLYNWDCG